MTPRIKICGLRRAEDVELAVELGAWAAGFIFHPASPRSIGAAAARDLALRVPPGVRKVGVFVDESEAELSRIGSEVGLDVLQLHGRESPDLARRMVARGFEVWKALRVGPAFGEADVLAFDGVDRVLLDTYRKGVPGGTGEVFDWAVAASLPQHGEIILAGGISPENVARAIEIVRPYAVDVSSGVEVAPGEKDAARLRELFARVSVDR